MKYKVYVEEIVITEYEVEANSKEDALAKASLVEGKKIQEIDRQVNENSEFWSVWDEKGNDLTGK